MAGEIHTVYFVQHGNTKKLRTFWDGPVVVREVWEGSRLLDTGAVGRYPDTPEGEAEARAHADRLNAELKAT